MDSADREAWEYETLRVPRGSTKKESADPEAELNELGSDGWELTDTVEYVGGGTKFLILKRPADGTGSAESGDGDGSAESGDGDGSAESGTGDGSGGTDASDETVGSGDDDEAAENGDQT